MPLQLILPPSKWVFIGHSALSISTMVLYCTPVQPINLGTDCHHRLPPVLSMPHSVEDKQRAITRLRRIKGQAEALERAVEAGSECAPILQQLAAMRGAVHGLMADLLDSHVRETLAEKPAPSQQAVDETLALLRSYLK